MPQPVWSIYLWPMPWSTHERRMQQVVWEFWCRAQRSRFAIPLASAIYMSIALRVQTQEMLKRTTGAEGESLSVLKRVLKLPSVSGWSLELRGCLSCGVKWSNCTVKSVKRHLLLKKMKDVKELYVSQLRNRKQF